MNTSAPIIGMIALILLVAGIAYVTISSPDPSSLNSSAGDGSSIAGSQADTNPMTFFVTSVNPGRGADLGGLTGADAYCRSLATTVGAGNKNWRAYLSVVATGTSPAVNARDRIGSGPWQNAKGVVIARSVDELHATNMLSKETALSERGEIVLGRGDSVNMHDLLTGSMQDGRASSTPDRDTTCSNWTSGTIGSAILGHHDRIGLDESDAAKSWNSSHLSRGCDLPALRSTGGAGLYYCFAAN